MLLSWKPLQRISSGVMCLEFYNSSLNLPFPQLPAFILNRQGYLSDQVFDASFQHSVVCGTMCLFSTK